MTNNLSELKDVKAENLRITQEIEGYNVIQKDLEKRIVSLYNTIDTSNVKINEYEKEIEHQKVTIQEQNRVLEETKQDKEAIESKLIK